MPMYNELVTSKQKDLRLTTPFLQKRYAHYTAVPRRSLAIWMLSINTMAGTALRTARSQVQFPTMLLEFFIDIILPAALRPWGRLSLQKK